MSKERRGDLRIRGYSVLGLAVAVAGGTLLIIIGLILLLAKPGPKPPNPAALPFMLAFCFSLLAWGIYYSFYGVILFRVTGTHLGLPSLGINLTRDEIQGMDIAQPPPFEGMEAAHLMGIWLTSDGVRQVGSSTIGNQDFLRLFDTAPNILVALDCPNFGPGNRDAIDLFEELRSRWKTARRSRRKRRLQWSESDS